MSQEKGPFETVTPLSPQSISTSSLGQQPTCHSTLSKWPSAPKPLKKSRWIRIAYTLWDIAMCLVPLLLLMKAGLIVVAYRIDHYKNGLVENPPSSLTQYSIWFNTQVRQISVFCI